MADNKVTDNRQSLGQDVYPSIMDIKVTAYGHTLWQCAYIWTTQAEITLDSRSAFESKPTQR
ncbi:MAG: hypothetical protein V6Z82_06360 [Flavobacteriales bacterium]